MTMHSAGKGLIKTALLASAAAFAIGASGPAAFAAETGGGGAKHQSGGSHGGSNAGTGGQKGAYTGGQMHGQGGQKGEGSKRLTDIFRDLTGDEGDEDSDRPEWAGQPGGKDGAGGGQPPTSGSKKGDLFGDLWIILRDENGVPVLTPEGWVQPIDENGNVIALDEEGHPVDETLTQEVELGRLNVGRAPTQVLDRRAEEVIGLLNDATDLSLDPAGRLIVTTVDADGVETSKTIDSPLENLAIYVALMTDGSIPGVDDLPGDAFDFMVDGEYTAADLAASASFLAAATDKTGAFTPDEIAYLNTFVDVNTVKVGSVVYSEIDYASVDYDRSDAFGETTATVLVDNGDGTFEAREINVFETIFGGVDASASGTLDAYTLMADDARTVINYIHEFEVPSLEVSH